MVGRAVRLLGGGKLTREELYRMEGGVRSVLL